MRSPAAWTSNIVLCAALAATPLTSAAVAAQTCEPPDSSNEVGIFGNRSLALAAGRGIAHGMDTPWTVRLGVEAALLPRLSDADATPTACRPGKGPENVNVLPAVARVRAAVVLPGRHELSASWAPPVTLEGMRANLLGIALARDFPVSPQLALVARVHGVVGVVTGPVTCDSDAIADESSECFGGAVSSDRYRPNIFGADLSADWTPVRSPYVLWGGLGYTRLSPRFRVHFRNADGVLDRTLVRADVGRIAMFAGASRRIGQRGRAGVEAYATTDDGATIRVVADAIIRRGR